MTKYDGDTKLAAVHAYLEGEISYKRTAQKFGVSTTMLKKWVANFRDYGVAAFQARYTKRN
jgi:transposase